MDKDTLPNGMSDFDFGEEDLLEATNEFPSNSSVGPDVFSAMMLKQCRLSLTHQLFLFWRKSMNEGTVRDICTEANITPIHKGKSPAIPKNYRPVALTSLLVKTSEKVICTQLVNFLDEHDLFNDSQYGYRRTRSCLSQLLAHFDHITDLLELGICVDVMYLDFAKALDKVDIGITLRILKSLGIHGQLGKWLQSFLSGRLHSVLVEGKKSVLSGVSQESILGLLLFLILIGDIDQYVATSFLSSFVDDTRIGHGITSEEDMRQLQADLNSVYSTAANNNMEFNSEKFEFIQYSPSRRACSPRYGIPIKYRNTNHSQVNEFKML